MSDVYVYIYDISKGLAQQMSFQLLGKQIDGIWHTGITVFRKEIYFGSNGIESCLPEMTILGPPDKKYFIGRTLKAEEDLINHLKFLSQNTFHGSKYELLYHNCNTFSNVLALWLTGKSIPNYILDLPLEILSTPLGSILQPFIERYSPTVSAAYVSTFTSYNNEKSTETKLNPVIFEEPLHLHSNGFLKNSYFVLNTEMYEILLKLFDISNGYNFSQFSNELHEIIRIASISDLVDYQTKLVIFDVIRLNLIKNSSVLSVFINLPFSLFEEITKKENSYEIEEIKCKVICNIVGLAFDHQLPKEVLKLMSLYALELMRQRKHDLLASSLIKNLIFHKSDLEIDTCLEIASLLIYLISENSVSSNDKTKENVLGSILFLTKNYTEIKELAKSYEIDNKIGKETVFSQPLIDELQK